METEKPLIDNDYQLVEVGGKMSWTFAEIPEIPMPNKDSFQYGESKGED